MRKHFPLNSQGTEDAAKLPWTDGVPSTGVEGSYPGQALFTDTEAEILAAIDGGGFLRSGADLTQLLQAIARGLWLGVFGGTATALTAALPNNLVIPSLQAGMRVRGIAASDFTGTGGTLKITGVGTATGIMSCPLVGSDGTTALASGAWKAGQFLTFDIDASGNARFGGMGSAGGVSGLGYVSGQCRLVVTNGTTLTLLPRGPGKLWVNGALATIPSGGVTLSNTGLNAVNQSTGAPLYYLYAVAAGGLVTGFEASTTGHVTAADGTEVKSGDPTRALIGMGVLDGTAGSQGTFVDSPTKRYLANHFARRARRLVVPAPTITSTTSTAYVEAPIAQRLGFLTWDDEACIFNINGNDANDTNIAGAHIAIGIDGAQFSGDNQNTTADQRYYINANTSIASDLAEGFHYSSPLISAHNGTNAGPTTGIFTLFNSALVRI